MLLRGPDDRASAFGGFLKRLAILGSTGSIGRSALSVVDANSDKLHVISLVAGGNVPLLAEQIARYRPQVVGIATDAARKDLIDRLPASSSPPTVGVGADAMIAAVTHPDVDLVLCATSGTSGLEAALAAIKSNKAVALANKEILVMAGGLVVDAARRHGIEILPVDSEHNAIHQCLHARRRRDVKRLILTASGGPFRSMTEAQLASVTPADALKHPTWQMGKKITIDSATLMNKGLEVIEAHWLFGVTAADISVVVHPQSIVHSMVEFCDGTVMAQMSVPDMRLPIQYAFSYPERWGPAAKPLDIAALGSLEFAQPDLDRFPCLRLAYWALERGGSWPIVLNAANEVAVEAFLEGRLPLPGIPKLIEHALEAGDRRFKEPRTLEEVRAADAWARAFSAETLRTLRSS